jgi:hypothetical protein
MAKTIDRPWEKTGEANGIHTYQKSDGSNLLHVKGIIIIDQGIDKMGNLFRDIPNHVKWVGYCDEAKVIKVINRNQYIFYETMTPPWPVARRDMVLESKSVYTNKNLSVTISSRAIDYNKFPSPKDTVRIKSLNVKLGMEYITRNKTGIVYEIQVDPAGDIPSFISNIFNQIYVQQNLANLKAAAADKNYMATLNDTIDTELIEKLVSNDKILKSALKTRLSRLITSKNNLNYLINDTRFKESWVNNQSGLAEKLFFAGHDTTIARESVKKIISVYLERFDLSQDQLNKLSNNNQIHDIFLNNSIENSLTRNLIQDILIQKS